MRRLVPTLVRNRRLFALFIGMVILPASVFSVLMVRAIANEQLRTAYGVIERQRQIVRLAEADLNRWLFAPGGDAARAHAVLTFATRGEQIEFPEFHLALPMSGAPRLRPFETAPAGAPLTAEAVTSHYYPRVQVFLRDLGNGRHSGAQYFLRLRALVVRPREDAEGFVVGVDPVVQYLNGRLTELCASETFTARVWVAEAERNAAPAAETYGLVNFPFFEIVFADTGRPAVMHVRRHAFAYAMTALVTIAVLGSVFVHRAVSQEMRLSQLRKDFVAAVSHEFRSPLSSITMLAERLVSQRSLAPAQLAEYHRIIEGDARRLSGLVTRLLEFARIEDGRAIYALAPLDLVQATDDAVAPFRNGGGSRVRFKAEPGPLWIRGDRDAVSHAIQNLIENAAKYSPPDAPIEVNCAAVNGTYDVAVRDFGIGVAAAERDRIFEKFYRGQAVASMHVQGVGLGLALVKHVMEAHGGSVSIESDAGNGSCFRLHFPPHRA